MKVVASVCACTCALVSIAAAEPNGDQLRASGEKLAKNGRYSEAIAAFKAADKSKPRATNWCLIGLAYTRRELWPQAEIMIERCKQLASAADPLPSWLPALETQLADRIAAVDVAPIEVAVAPTSAGAELSVSSFAPDETFHPRVIHLPFGRQVISATAPGYAPAEVAVDVADRKPQRIVVTLRPVGTPEPVPPLAPPPDTAPTTATTALPPVTVAPLPPTHRTHPVPWIVMGVGAGLVAVGAVVEATSFKTAADHLSDAHDSGDAAEYTQWSSKFDTRRDVVIGFYAGGAVAIGVGLVLALTGQHDAEHGAQLSLSPTPGGSMINVGWSR